jgi:hypothetical protein
MSESSLGPLNLQDADLTGFDAIDPGRYNAEIFQMSMDAVKNTSGTGKMPAGTPMIKIQFKITDPPVDNRRVFLTYVIPPADYDASKAAKMKGMIVRFFMAMGHSEEEVRNPNFDPQFDEYVGRPCVITVSKEPKRTMQGEIIPDEFNNSVKGVRPAGTLESSVSSIL